MGWIVGVDPGRDKFGLSGYQSDGKAWHFKTVEMRGVVGHRLVQAYSVLPTLFPGKIFNVGIEILLGVRLYREHLEMYMMSGVIAAYCEQQDIRCGLVKAATHYTYLGGSTKPTAAYREAVLTELGVDDCDRHCLTATGVALTVKAFFSEDLPPKLKEQVIWL